MASEPVAASGENLGGAERVVVSMVRFSSACALFSFESAQNAFSWQEGRGVSKAMHDLGDAFDSISERLVSQMGDGNRHMVLSATKITEQVLQTSMHGLEWLDPRRLMSSASGLAQSASQAVTSRWPGNSQQQSQPALAADVLTSPK